MAISIAPLIYLIISALFYAVGEYLSKKWGGGPNVMLTILVIVSYSLGVLFWLPALLYKNQLVVMGTIWIILATIMTLSVGIFIFHEQITAVQWVGVIFSVVALILIGA